MNQKITITRPDDWHLHVRDGDLLGAVIGHSAARFGRALIMPNLNPPVRDVAGAGAYRESILSSLAASAGAEVAGRFDPVMSLYLTDLTSASDVRAAAESDIIGGFKLYPAGATTNSSLGVSQVSGLFPVFEAMAALGVVLQVHGEVTDSHVDIFDREAVFIEQVLAPLIRELPELKVVFEHITTRQGVEFVRSCGGNVAATITPQHLMYSRNEIFRGGIRPHLYCLPILKRHEHQLALLEAAVSGDSSFFLGTDSAPHLRGAKEAACGCAGCYSAHGGIEFYAEVFDGMEALDKLEGFASFFGADFYGVPRNSDSITLERCDWVVPGVFEVAGVGELVPLRAGEVVGWKLID